MFLDFTTGALVPDLSEKSTVQAIWKIADAVCFDVDSTVIKEEAIDELAAFCGKRKEVASLTRTAMSGKMEFREALATRLEMISPTLMQVRAFIKDHALHITPNVQELIEKLHERNVPVFLVSGGFRGLIGPVARQLNIPAENVFANSLKFYLNGQYAGFDENEPTSKSGGKGEVMKFLKTKYQFSNLVMIGDGITDFEASPPADAFIGFGGNVVREEVKRKSKWYVMDFQELIDCSN